MQIGGFKCKYYNLHTGAGLDDVDERAEMVLFWLYNFTISHFQIKENSTINQNQEILAIFIKFVRDVESKLYISKCTALTERRALCVQEPHLPIPSSRKHHRSGRVDWTLVPAVPHRLGHLGPPTVFLHFCLHTCFLPANIHSIMRWLQRETGPSTKKLQSILVSRSCFPLKCFIFSFPSQGFP